MRRVDSGFTVPRPVQFLGVLALAMTMVVSVVWADEVELVWKKPAGKEAFDLGKAEYEAGHFKEAHEAFKDAKRHAKDKATKAELGRWERGAVGGKELAELKKHVDAGRASDAYTIAEKNYRLYEATPVGPAYKQFLEDLEKKLFTVIEDFERKTARYSEKYGKTFVEDADVVKQGKRCLRWEVNKKNYELKVKDLPKDLDAYAKGAVVFWLKFEGGSGPYQLAFDVPGKGTAATTGARVDNAFIMQMKAHSGGWKKIEVPLKSFTQQGSVEWSRVRDFRIQFLGGRKFTCHVDSIKLRK